MKALLTGGLCGWPADRVDILEDVAAPNELATRLVELTEAVEDVLLLYYVGHGMRIPNGQLALALRDTSSNRALLRHTAMAYKDIAEILRSCQAATKIVILDCCHAELGNRATYQFQSADIDDEPVEGLYCIWASKEWEKAKSPLSGGLTYFTDAFVGVVMSGITRKPAQLTIDQIFAELRIRLLRANLPEPAQSGIRDAHQWPFAHNAAQPETHRDPDREIEVLLEWKAAAEARERALQTQVAEHAAELERLKARASNASHLTAEEEEGLRNAISTTERLLDDSVAAKAAARADYPKTPSTPAGASAPPDRPPALAVHASPPVSTSPGEDADADTAARANGHVSDWLVALADLPLRVVEAASAPIRRREDHEYSDEDDDYSWPGRRRWPIVTGALVLLVILVFGGVYGAWWYNQQQYYVGVQDGYVSIFHGTNESVVGINLSSLLTQSTLKVSLLSTADRSALSQTVAEGSVAKAESVVDQLQVKVGSCRTEWTALATWHSRSVGPMPPVPKAADCAPAAAFGIPASALPATATS